MTDLERAQIMKLQSEGLGYKKISSILGLPVNGVKSFCRRNPIVTKSEDKRCRYCGKSIIQPRGRKEKLYCSDSCRMAWWKEHRSEMKKKAYYELTCQQCGQVFMSYGNVHQKYCGLACYGLSRRKEAQHEQ